MTKRNKIWAWIIGSGIVLMAIHNPHLTITIKGTTWLFLPQLGEIIALMATFVCIAENYKKITLGSKWIWIPLAIIALSIIISEIIQYATGNATRGEAIGFGGIAVFMFLLYLLTRILGEELFKPFTIVTVIVAISCVVYGLIDVGVKQGGLASPTNYDMATGLLVLGTLVSSYKKIWWLSALTIVGLYFTGSDEAIFACGVLFIAVLIRRDWSKKLLLPVGAIVITLILCTSFGITQKLYFPTVQKIALAKEYSEGTPIASIIDAVVPDAILKPITKELDIINIDNPLLIINTQEDTSLIDIDNATKSQILNVATGYRWVQHWKLSPIKPFGYGFNMSEFYWGIPHNTVLVIIEQVGILAAIAWLIVVIYCLIKTKWKYAFIAILALSVFDHYLFTQVSPWIWCIIGVASVSKINNDHIFKGQVCDYSVS